MTDKTKENIIDRIIKEHEYKNGSIRISNIKVEYIQRRRKPKNKLIPTAKRLLELTESIENESNKKEIKKLIFNLGAIKQPPRVGLLLAVLINGKLHIGYSLKSKEDKFDKNIAFDIALSRAIRNFYRVEKNPEKTFLYRIPESIIENMDYFIDRCKKYYKDVMFPHYLSVVVPKIVNFED